MVVLPKLTPVTTPVVLMVATDGSLMVHVPPGVVLLSVVLSPVQTVAVPVMAGSPALTVTTVMLVQPAAI